MNNTFLSQLNWRFATKDFDTDKKIDQDKLDQILEAIRMAPTSFGLQTLHTYVISDQKIQDMIKDNSYSQSQVSDASHLLVFCYRTDVMTRVDQYVELSSQGNPAVKEKLKPMEEMMKGAFSSKSDEEIATWSARQVYIALGFAMAACAELGIDSCPMEGFDHNATDEILELPENMKSVVILPMGYRKEEPKRAKVRFSKEDLFTFVK